MGFRVIIGSWVFLQFLCSSLYASEADSTKNPLTISGNLHYGFIISHSSNVKEQSKTNPWGLELEIAWQQMGDKSWQKCFCYPRIGASLTYFNFANSDVLGRAYAASLFVEPHFNIQRKVNVSFKGGTGLVYLDQPYDPETNPENLFYSTHFSFILFANLQFNYRIIPSLQLHIAGNYNHISNGSTKQPNKGINFPTLSLGLTRYFSKGLVSKRSKIPLSELHPNRNLWRLALFSTGKEVANEQKKYWVLGISGYFTRVVGRMSGLSMGTEIVLDGAAKEQLERSGSSDSHFTWSLIGGHEFLLGRFVFSQQLGAYLVKEYDTLDPLYQRYGLTYHFTKSLFLGANLKVHRHVADFLDFRLGVTL